LKPVVADTMEVSFVHVVVSSIGGDCLEWDLPMTLQVKDLKTKIVERWPIPAACQKLVAGEHIMSDQDKLSAYCETDQNILSVLVLVSSDALTAGLDAEKASWMEADKALEIIAQLGARGVPSVTPLLQNDLWSIRQSAVNTLGEIGTKGDQAVIDAVSTYIEDEDWGVRLAVLKALGKLSKKNDGQACASVIPLLSDPQWVVRCQALAVLASISRVGDDDVVLAVLALLEQRQDTDSDVKRAAIEALGKLAKKGDMRAITTLRGHLDDQRWHVRKAAVLALKQLAQADGYVRALLRPCLKDENEDVRSEVEEALRQLKW